MRECVCIRGRVREYNKYWQDLVFLKCSTLILIIALTVSFFLTNLNDFFKIKTFRKLLTIKLILEFYKIKKTEKFYRFDWI